MIGVNVCWFKMQVERVCRSETVPQLAVQTLKTAEKQRSWP